MQSLNITPHSLTYVIHLIYAVSMLSVQFEYPLCISATIDFKIYFFLLSVFRAPASAVVHFCKCVLFYVTDGQYETRVIVIFLKGFVEM